MSWTPEMTKEAFKSANVSVKRHKTGKRIKVWFESNDPYQIVTLQNLEYGEILEDRDGNKVKVMSPDGLFTRTWKHKVFNVEFV